MELFFLQIHVFGIVLGLLLALFVITVVCFFVAQKPRGMPWYKFCTQLGIIEIYEHFDQKRYDEWAAAVRKLAAQKTNRRFLVSDTFTTVRFRMRPSKILTLFK